MNDPYHIWKTAINVTRWIGSPVSLAVHTVIFISFFLAVHYDYVEYQEMLLVLTTIVSLEAIYLSIFLQMTINYTTQELQEVSEDIEEMQEDIGEIQEDVDELQEDVEEITEDEEAEEAQEKARSVEQRRTLADIQADLRKLMQDIARLQKHEPPVSTP
ncbi:MAG: hypothetical protein RLZZ416_129 [Candidatus Parcubacteria bacterium]|jgi:uncharacterized protein YoxC